MPPKGNKQAIADRRSQKQQKLQEQWDEEEESWDDSQAEEVSDEEEMESWESLDEELEDKPQGRGGRNHRQRCGAVFQRTRSEPASDGESRTVPAAARLVESQP